MGSGIENCNMYNSSFWLNDFRVNLDRNLPRWSCYYVERPRAILAGATAWGTLLEGLFPERDRLIQPQVD